MKSKLKNRLKRWTAVMVCITVAAGSLMWIDPIAVAGASVQEGTLGKGTDVQEKEQEASREEVQDLGDEVQENAQDQEDNLEQPQSTPQTREQEEVLSEVQEDEDQILIEEQIDAKEYPVMKEHEPLDLDLEEIDLGRQARALLPYYSSLDAGIVTSVKDQGSNGLCWAFTTTALAEISAIKNGITINGVKANQQNTDLSELHTGYFYSHRPADPLGNTKGDQVVLEDDYRAAGNETFFTSFSYANGIGAVMESELPYDQVETLESADPAMAYNHPVALKNAYFIANDVNQIKAAVSKYGAASIAYRMITRQGEDFYNADTAAYCNPTGYSVNHEVTIVGWDDNFSKNNFTKSSSVTSDGAWIVKNSWGTEYGKNGIFYISYEDSTLMDPVAMEFQNGDKYDYNYQYDGTPGVTSASLVNGGKIANVYQVKGKKNTNEILKAVSFAVQSAEITYSIQVYTDIQDPKNPTSGIKALEAPVTGKTTYAGIYNVDLGKDVRLSYDTSYAIVITLSGQSQIRHFVEANYDLGYMKGQVATAAGQSFVSQDGSTWTDMASSAQCARVKGFTVEDTEAPLLSPRLTIKATNNTTYTLSWEPSAGVDGYYIYRKEDGSMTAPFTRIATVTGGSTVGYEDKNLAFAPNYYYQIRSFKNVKVGQATYPVLGTSSGNYLVQMKLGAATLTGVTAQSNTAVKISWNKVYGATRYEIQRKNTTGTYTTLVNVEGGDTCTYTHTNPGTGTWYYRVRAVHLTSYNTLTWGAFSGEKPITITDGIILEQPTITGLTSPGVRQMNMTWSKVTKADGYQIQYQLGSEPAQKKDIPGGSTTTFSYTGIRPGEWVFRIHAYQVVNGVKIYGPYSAKKNVTISDEVILEQPTITGLTSPGVRQMNMTWSKVTKADGYQMQYQLGSEPAQKKDVPGGSTTTFSYTGIRPGEWVFRIKAYQVVNGVKKYGSYSAKKKVTISDEVILEQPTITGLTSPGVRQMNMTWSEVTKADGYQMQYQLGSEPAQKKDVPGGSTTTFSHTGIRSGEWVFRIKAYQVVNGVKEYGPYSERKKLIIK